MENITLEKINFVNGSAGKTPLNSNNINAIQQNTENAINEVVPIITGIEENTENNNSDIAEAKINIANNTNNILEINKFIANSMKTLETEGTSIHVSDSADYGCNLRVEGKSEQVQTEQGKNLLPFKDINFTLKGVNFYTENGNLYLNGASTGEILTNDNAYITYLNFKLPAGTYKFKHFSSLNVNMAIQLKKVSDKSELASINLNSNTVKTFTLNEETEVYLGIYIYNQNFNSENLKLMLSIEDATEYEPFVPDSPSPNYRSDLENTEGDLEIKVVGKNLMRCETEVQTKYGVTITKTDDGGYILNGTSTGIGINGISLINFEHSFPLIKNNSYVYSVEFENVPNNKVSFPIAVKQVDGTIKYNYKSINTESETAPVVFIPYEDLTTDNVAVYIHNGTVFNNFKFKIQIEKNNVATAYEPYKEQSVTFPLGEQKLMQDGYLGDDGIHNKRIQIVLTGNENWTLSGRQFEKCACFHIGIDNNPKINMLCNAFKYNQMAYNNSTDEECITNNVTSGTPNIIIVQIDKTRLATQDVAGFKAWLAEQYSAGTPIIVEYEMQEEETTAYTSEQQTAYNALQKLKTYRTVTNISNNQNTNMQLTYKKDLQTQFQELETMLLESGV